MDNILECKDLSKRYGPKLALNSISLSLTKGKIIGLLGTNGSGKTTLIKLVSGILTKSSGSIRINGMEPGIESKKIVSYLPDRNYLPDWMTANDVISMFSDFYANFDKAKALDMLNRLSITPSEGIKAMSKGTKEKVQLALVMSRNADLYLLDEPIGGVDPAARDYILNTIISNYNENATVVISTHLIADIETVLDEVIFISNGQITMTSSVEEIRENQGKSVDALFREVFKC